MGRYVDGLCRRVERGGREERSGQRLCHLGSVVESARFQKAGPFYAFSEKGFSGQNGRYAEKGKRPPRALPARGRFDLLSAVNPRFRAPEVASCAKQCLICGCRSG